jgi:metal-responsive CopG/Arc/MetJ family transcriptional regulator
MTIMGAVMSIAKIAVSIDDKQLKKIDFYVKKHVFKNRSQAFQLAISHTLEQLEHKRLEKECAKLDVNEEQELADMGLDEDLTSWPKY